MVGLCRLCASLRKMDVLVTINHDTSEICEKLRNCCALNIKADDALPKSICQECIENLNNSHKFYIKVKEAQETLESLYPSPSSLPADTRKENKRIHSSAVQTGPMFKEKPSVIKQNKLKLANESKKLTETPSKEITLEPYLPEETKDFERDFHTGIETRLSEEDGTQRVYNMLDVTKEAVSDNSYEILETVEEAVDLFKNERNDDFCEVQKQLNEECTVLEQNNGEPPLITLNESNLESDEVIKQLNDMISEDELHVEVEFMECYDDEEQDEIATTIDIEQYVNDNGQIKQFSLSPYHLKLTSWKNYKYLCFICDGLFSNFIGLKTHIEQEHHITHTDKLLYKCYDCKKIIPRYNFFLNHVRSKHHNALKLKCDVCDLSCRNFEQLSIHRSANCAEANNYAYTVPCSQCFKSFRSVFGLQNHCKFQHDSSKTKVKYKCTLCNKEFQYKSCLKTHELLHTDTKKFSCIYCGKAFYNKLNLEQHLYVHVDEKIYQCNICYKSYKTFQILDEHQKLHTSEKPFKCQFCDKCFTQKVQKLAHERTHTGEMPYPCKQCDKRFRYRSALHAHSKIHTGDKPYSCEYCIKTFADSSNRNKHVKRMHSNSKRKENIQK